MKKIIIIVLYIVSFFTVNSQETYFVTAKSGLFIREKPNINSSKIGKLPYGSVIALLETTNKELEVTDNGKVIKGNWIKVAFYNAPFIVSNFKGYKHEEEGYVFSGFTEKLNKATITVKEIDSVTFYSQYKEIKPEKLPKITSAKRIKKLLASKVKWGYEEFVGVTVNKITLDNGQTLTINHKNYECGLDAYYPTEKVLLFECGHSGTESISMQTGESLETVGNPEYIRCSPSKKLRLNGWFSGQECSSYFFQEKTANGYVYLTDIGWDSKNERSRVCSFDKFYWLSDTEFMYSESFYHYDESGKAIEKYYLAKITKHKRNINSK